MRVMQFNYNLLRGGKLEEVRLGAIARWLGEFSELCHAVSCNDNAAEEASVARCEAASRDFVCVTALNAYH